MLYDTVKHIVEGIDGYMPADQCRLLFNLAQTVPSNGTVVEIGCYKGRSTSAIGFGLMNIKDAKIFTIDTFEGNPSTEKSFKETFYKNMVFCGVLNKIVNVIEGNSECAIKSFETFNKLFDMLFIDGSHKYEDIKTDFTLYFPKVKIGGILALHDVYDGSSDVTKLWEEEIKDKLKDIRNVGSLYYGIKC